MRFSRFAKLLPLLVLASCAGRPYRDLRPSGAVLPESRTVLQAPQLDRTLYRCVVDGGFLLKKYHLSGILLLKAFPDGVDRVVFQNEMGVSFFNFKWDARDSFSVTSIIPQLDKPAVIKLLRNDFELLLRKNLDTAAAQQLGSGMRAVAAVRKNTGTAWYEVSGRQIVYGGRSPVTTISIDSNGAAGTLPYRLRIRHHKANFTIDLTQLPQDEQ